MTEGLIDRGRPSRWLRWFLRAPIWLYRLGLGGLLGGRFLMITHVGRRSGLARRTVVEVVSFDEASRTYYVCSGWGPGSDWYRNIQKTPDVEIHVRWRRFACRARHVEVDEGTRVLLDYATRNPMAWRKLSEAMIGEPLAGDLAGTRRLAEKAPMLAFQAPPGA